MSARKSGSGMEASFSRREALGMAGAGALGLLMNSDKPRDVKNYGSEQMRISHEFIVDSKVYNQVPEKKRLDFDLVRLKQYFIESIFPKIAKEIKASSAGGENQINLRVRLINAEPDVKYLEHPESTEEIFKNGREAIADAIDFWDHPKLVKPNPDEIDFFAPSGKEMRRTFGSFPTDPVVQIHLFESGGTRFDAVVDGVVNGQNKSWSENYFVHDVVGGSAHREFNILKKGENYEVVWGRHPIYWYKDGMQVNDPNLIRYIPTEILHMQVGFVTIDRNTKEFLQSRPPKRTAQIPKNIALEEAVVHAIGNEWFTNYAAKKGFKDTPNTHLHRGTDQLYRAIKGRGQQGAHELIDRFIDEPVLLAKEAGLQ